MADETRDQARRIAELEARLEGYVRRIEAVETRKLVLARELDVAEARLAQIAALCDVAEDEPSGWVDGEPLVVARHIREVLAERAPVAPSHGVTLTSGEAALARTWYMRLPIGVTPDDVALARRLEAAP